jgi:hypothetical protein
MPREFINRMRDCGLDPMVAMVSANSLGAEALGLGDQVGSISVIYVTIHVTVNLRCSKTQRK